MAKGNCTAMFSKPDMWVILVLVLAALFAFLIHRLIGCLGASDCILVAADSALVWSHSHAGCIPDSISIAVVGVVR